MSKLTFDRLRSAVAGDAVALRSRTTLQPAGGPGDKVFPPTYAVDRGSHKYAIEERRLDDNTTTTTVLLDSVASQANRAELALLEGWELDELQFPVPYVDFASHEEVQDLGRLTVLEAPHRFADAIFRDSLLDGTLFRLSDIGRAITDAQPRNATALFRYAPTALLFGQWDSTGPKGGLGSKFQRAYVSEIVGLDAKIGVKVGSRLDPLQIERKAGGDQILVHEDRDQVWTMNPEEAETNKKGPERKGDGTPAEINHGNIAPSIDGTAGGVTISKAIQTTVVSLAALRRLRFPGHEREAEIAARTAIAALGVVSIAYQHEMDFDLRSRCLLLPEHAPRIELLSRDGSSAEVVDLDRTLARELIHQAADHAKKQGIGWEESETRLDPAPKLLELIRKSREVAATKSPSE